MHHSGTLFNLTVVYANTDSDATEVVPIVKLNPDVQPGGTAAYDDQEDGWAFGGNFWIAASRARSLPEPLSKATAEVWFGRVV